jgi:hypothetical protein
VCGIGPWKCHFGLLFPRTIFGVPFFWTAILKAMDVERGISLRCATQPPITSPVHVPGMYAWLVAAELGIALADAACNGRGHPTVKMGSRRNGMHPRPR